MSTISAPKVSSTGEFLPVPRSELVWTATFVSIRRVSLELGFEQRVVRELIVRGYLEPVELGIATDGRRQVRYVTTASVRAYIERARAAGGYAIQLCARCQGMRYARPGTTLCGPCADRLAQRAEERQERTRERKREWWAANGPEWRARRRAAARGAQSTDETGRNRMGIGNMSPEEAAKMEAEGAAQTAAQQAEFAESQAGYTGEAPPVDPSTMSDDELYARGLAPYSDLTSPGGPWHGLPLEASTDPSHPQWAENQRWACVQGSFFAYTVDGTTAIGEEADNVRGYGIPTEAGAGYMRSISHLPEAERIEKCIEQGNLIAYRGDNIDYTLAG